MSAMDRREFLRAAVIGVGSALGATRAQPSLIEDAKASALDLKITCTTEILKQPAGKLVGLWMPVPPDDREQEVTGLSVSSRIPHRSTRDEVWGNKMLFFTAESESLAPGEKISLSCRVRRKATGVIGSTQDDPKRFTSPSQWEKWDDDIVRFVNELIGNETDPVKIGRMAYDAVIDRVSYLHEACGRGVAAFTFEEKVGRCDEFHALFRSIMMYKGIPVKWEQGLLLPYPSVLEKKGELEADCINAHSWVRFHVGGGRWMPADLSEAKRRPELRDFYFGRLAPNRIKMSTGRGFDLNPKQEGTVDTFPFAYAEADGIPLIYSHHYKNVLKYEVAGMESRNR